MKKPISINCLILFILFNNLMIYCLFFESNDNGRVTQIEGTNFQIKLNGIHSPINITGNNDFTPSNGVSSGDGTFDNPYIIKDLIIEVVSSGNCIFINNTNAFFKIQNCTLKNSGLAIDRRTIKFNNVSNGLILNSTNSNAEILLSNSHNNSIVNNNFKINSGIFLSSSDNNTISHNTIVNCINIHFLFSDNNKILNNSIQNCTIGIKFQFSSDNIINGNEIYDCQEYGIGLWSQSSNNQIIDNYIYNNANKTGSDQIDIDFDSSGTTLTGNIYSYRDTNGDGDGNGDLPPFDPTLLIIVLFIIIGSIAIITVTIFLIFRRYRKEKEFKHPKTSEPPDTSDLW